MALFLESQISKFLAAIPASPKTVSEAIKLAKDNKLAEAAAVLEADPIIKAYILNKASSPSFTFIEKPKNLSHALSLFGAPLSLAVLESYLLEALMPKKWHIFKLSNEQYHSIHNSMLTRWQNILDKTVPSKARVYASAAALLLASLPICDVLLASKSEYMELVRENGLKLNDVLFRLGKMSLYSVAAKVGELLDFDKNAIMLVRLAEKPMLNESKELEKLSKLLHLLLFYQLSEPLALESGLDAFAVCHTSFIGDELETFMNIVGADFEN